MAILTNGSYTASIYNLPNTLYGSYESVGYSIKNRINELKIDCTIQAPGFNHVDIDFTKTGITTVFTGRLLDENYYEDYTCYAITYKDGEWYVVKDYNSGKSTEWTAEIFINQNLSKESKSFEWVNDEKTTVRIHYNPCYFKINVIAIINGAEVPYSRTDADFEYDENFKLLTNSNGKCYLQNPITNIGEATAFRYNIEFMTNDDEKSYYFETIDFIGNDSDSQTNIRQGYVVIDICDCITPNAITNISYTGTGEDAEHEIYVASKIYNSESESPSPSATRWSSKYLNHQNKVILVEGEDNNTTTSKPFVLYYDPEEHVSVNYHDNTVTYQTHSLIIGGGLPLRDPESLDYVSYYSALNGDTSGDDKINANDINIMPSTNINIGYKDYVEYYDLNRDEVIDSQDRNIILNNMNKETLINGGYIKFRVYKAENYNTDKKILISDTYIYEENTYRISLDNFTEPVVFEFFFKRLNNTYESPYINFLGIQTTNNYEETVRFGPSYRYECILDEYNYKTNSCLTFTDKKEKEVKELRTENIDFSYPYWFKTSNLETVAENAIQIITYDDFTTRHPNVSLSLQYNVDTLANFKGNEFVEGFMKDTQSMYQGAYFKGYKTDLDTGEIAEDDNQDVALTGEEIHKWLRQYKDRDYYHILANFVSRIDIVCVFDLDNVSGIYHGICNTRDKTKPNEIKVSLDEGLLNPFKEYKYIVNTKYENDLENIQLQLKTDEKETENANADNEWYQIIALDNLDQTIYVVATDRALDVSTINQYAHSFKGVYNSGNNHSLYSRDLTAYDLPSLSNMKYKDVGSVSIISEDGIKLEKLIYFDEATNALKYITVNMTEAPSHYLDIKGIDTAESTVKTIKKNSNSYEELFISYEDLSRELNRQVNKDSIIDIDILTDNADVEISMGEDGIYFNGKEKYDIRNQWIPKIKSGFYNIGKSERFYNPDMENINIDDIYPGIISNVSYVDGPYLTMAHIGSPIKITIEDNSESTEYVMYEKKF